MNQGIQHESHLDADQLNAFAEGALSGGEREQCLAHLSGCEQCRSVLYLAMPEGLPAEQLTVKPAAGRGWWATLSAVGLAFACAAVVMVAIHARRSAVQPPPQVAAVRPVEQPSLPPDANRGQEAARSRDKAAHVEGGGVALPRPAPRRSVGAPTDEIQAQEPLQALPTIGRGSTTLALVPEKKAVSPMESQAQLPLQSQRNGSEAGYGFAPQQQSPVMAAPQSQVQASAAASEQQSAGMMQGRVLRQSAAAAPLAGSPGLTRNGVAIGAGLGVEPSPITLTIEPGHSDANGLAALTGAVTDPSGAVVPGANIVLRQIDGAMSRSAITNPQGVFNLAELPVGRYELKIASPGFLTVTRQVQLGDRDLAVVATRLPLGSESETVTVSSDAATVESADSQSLSSMVALVPAWVSEVSVGGSTLALDAKGKLHLMREGKRWKSVKSAWMGKVLQLEAAGASDTERSEGAYKDARKEPAVAGDTFRITTDHGEVWSSPDGTHWQKR